MSEADDIREGYIKAGLKRNISDEAMRRADAAGIPYDIVWEDTPESYAKFVEDQGDTTPEGDDDGELWDDDPESRPSDIAIDEFFPKRDYMLSEDNKPLEVEEAYLFDQNESYEDKLE